MKKTIEKPWGKEVWLEVNENYVVKEIHLKKGESCSLQYHEKKHESFYVVKGKLKFYYGKQNEKIKELILSPCDYFIVQPLLIHRMEGITDCVYLECSTNFLDDVVRIKDNYDRI